MNRIANLAKIITEYSLDIKEGMEVVIRASPIARPLVLEIYKNIVEKGADALQLISFDDSSYIYFKHAPEASLRRIPKITRYIYENADVFINILSDENTKALNNIDPEKRKIRSQSTIELQKIFMEREEKGEIQWVVLPYPTQALAQEAGMSLIEYEDFVYSACYADKEDGVRAWEKIHEEQQRIVNYLNRVKEIRIVGEDTDISIGVEGRKWINSDGHKNMPDGEVFTSPIEDAVNGKIRFTYPAIYAGVEVEDIQLVFKDGVVIDAKAAKGEAFLKKMLETDEGAKRLGEAAIGTNYGINRFTKNILFDEKLGHTIHLALGMGFPEAGGKNMSGIHWDMIKNMKNGGKIYADGDLIYENGNFLI